jgi:hypothetical protein
MDGITAIQEPTDTSGGISARSSSKAVPAAPKTVRRIALSVIRIIGSRVSNSRPTPFVRRIADGTADR